MHHHDSQQLPFELVALEVALKEVVNAAGMQVRGRCASDCSARRAACGRLPACPLLSSAVLPLFFTYSPPNRAQVKELEGVALPALDALTKSVSTGNLERVRKVKTRHQRLMIRCETLR